MIDALVNSFKIQCPRRTEPSLFLRWHWGRTEVDCGQLLIALRGALGHEQGSLDYDSISYLRCFEGGSCSYCHRRMGTYTAFAVRRRTNRILHTPTPSFRIAHWLAMEGPGSE